MEEVIISPFITFLFLLIYKNRYSQIITIGPGQILPPPPGRGKRGREERREKREVEKMMSCKGPDRGCFVYYCPKCEEYREISLGCNSRLCSDCVSGKMFNVPHRHAVMPFPDKLRSVLKEERRLCCERSLWTRR